MIVVHDSQINDRSFSLERGVQLNLFCKTEKVVKA